MTQSKKEKLLSGFGELVFFYLNFRRGIDPCARAIPSTGSSETVQVYEQPNSPTETAHANETANDQYAELDEPQFAGYKNQI